jgi:hypothetical protein
VAGRVAPANAALPPVRKAVARVPLRNLQQDAAALENAQPHVARARLQSDRLANDRARPPAKVARHARRLEQHARPLRERRRVSEARARRAWRNG